MYVKTFGMFTVAFFCVLGLRIAGASYGDTGQPEEHGALQHFSAFSDRVEVVATNQFCAQSPEAISPLLQASLDVDLRS
jgi:hypothetical protein